MKLKKVQTTLLCAAVSLLTSVFTTPVMAAEENLPLTLNRKLNRPAEFKEDAQAKTNPEIDSILDTKIEKYTKGTLVAYTDHGLAEVSIGERTVYVSQSSITTDESEMKALDEQKKKEDEEKKKREVEKKRQEEAEKAASNWNGPVLSRSAGTVQGPSGKETYYNLPMDGVVGIMHSMGNTGAYWVRSDGVKMLGDYVMVAAHLGLRPRGSLVPTSLGMGIVCDTGGFASGNPTQLDIATAW